MAINFFCHKQFLAFLHFTKACLFNVVNVCLQRYLCSHYWIPPQSSPLEYRWSSPWRRWRSGSGRGRGSSAAARRPAGAAAPAGAGSSWQVDTFYSSCHFSFVLLLLVLKQKIWINFRFYYYIHHLLRLKVMDPTFHFLQLIWEISRFPQNIKVTIHPSQNFSPVFPNRSDFRS